MPTAEGAIQFRYTLDGLAVEIDGARFAQLAAWRRILKQLDLIGRDPRRYDGFAYGNLSVRDATAPAKYFITASQTSGAATFDPRDLVRVDRWDAHRFEVSATGTAPPSSESITHGMVYAADPAVSWIMHVHSPAIWQAAARLQLPVTDNDVAYGSYEMATAVGTLMQRHPARPLVFATLGHEDGVFACGASADDTGAALVQTLAAAAGGTTP